MTGLGVVSPVGSTVSRAWENLTAGRSGIRPITRFDSTDFSVRICGSVIDFDADHYIPPKEQKKMDVFIHYGIAAAADAIRDAGLEVTEENAADIGVAIGSGIGGLPCIENNHGFFANSGPRRISPFFVPSSIINMVSGDLSVMFNLKGPNIAVVSACATGTHNIGLAARAIANRDADVMVAGGTEMATSPLGVGGFASARALSASHNDDPETASRPWDAERDGFVLGEGAGVVVLEEYEVAKSRGARIYCEVAGFGMNGDAHHMTQPGPGGEGAARCMRRALEDARISPQAVDYINAHGTSTPAGDKAETEAIKTVFEDHAKTVAISSNKSMIGHLLGAAGGVEAVFSILTLRHQVIPPTINYENPDPDCDLDYVPNTAREAPVEVVLSNSFGFGGTNGSLVFKRI